MAEKNRAEKRAGCVGRLAVLFVLLFLVGLGAALFFIALPQDVSDISGYGFSAEGRNRRDVVRALERSIEQGRPVTLSETDVNAFIRRTLEVKQGGLLGKWVSIEGVGVRFHDGYAEVVIERRIVDRPFTVSMFLGIEQTESADGKITTYVNRHGGPFVEQVPRLNRGGRFGQLVVPQGFLVLVLGSFEQLAAAYDRELELAVEEMSRIRIEENKLVLDPRLPDGPGFGAF